jgi:uncharacterized protein (TIRG00374 family)
MAGWLFGMAALAALLAFAAHLGEFERFLALSRSLAPEWLALALGLQAATYLSVAIAWRFALRRAGTRQSLRKLLPLALGKLFVDQSIPSGGMSGTAFLVAALARRGVPRPACLEALLANLVGHFGACLLAALLGLGLLRLEHGLQPWMAGVTALFVLVSVAIPAGVLALRSYGRREPAWLLRTPGAASLLESFATAPVTLLRQPSVVAGMVGWNAAVILLDAATLWVMLHALGLPTPYQVAFPSFVLAMMVATLGPIPLGLGTFEASCVAALVLLRIPIEEALTATLLLRGFTTWLPMLPGMLLVRRELRGKR